MVTAQREKQKRKWVKRMEGNDTQTSPKPSSAQEGNLIVLTDHY